MMSNKNLTLKFLQDIGLDESEIRTYFFLMSAGPQPVSSFSKRYKIYRMQAYRHLDNMIKKNVVGATLEYPKMFFAVPIEKLFLQHKESLQKTLSLLESRSKDILNYCNSLANSSNVKSDLMEHFKIIEGSDGIDGANIFIKRNTKEELSLLVPPRIIYQALLRGISDDLLQGKVKYKAKYLTQITKDTTSLEKKCLRKLGKIEKVEVRNTERILKPFPCFIISDRTEFALVTNISQPNNMIDPIALQTNNVVLTHLLKDYFDCLWTDAIDISKVLEH